MLCKLNTSDINFQRRYIGPSTCCAHHMLRPAHAALSTCCALHMLRPAHAAPCTCCAKHMLLPPHAAPTTCCAKHILRPPHAAPTTRFTHHKMRPPHAAPTSKSDDSLPGEIIIAISAAGQTRDPAEIRALNFRDKNATATQGKEGSFDISGMQQQ